MSRVGEDSRASLRFQRDGRATSPMYKFLLGVTYDDVERDGTCADVLAKAPADVDPIFEAMPLRFLGGVHRIVLDGRAPDLAVCYPSAGGKFDPDHPGDAAERFLQTVAEHHDELVESLTHGVQTNEVGRCAALLLGFLAVAGSTELPLRVLELGASAGLNLRWDRYRYEGGADGEVWGDPASPLRFDGVYVDPLPHIDIDAVVVERAGCDRGPIDATSADGALTLRSFLWPDQLERFAALDAALALAASVPVSVERADAGDWVEARLAERRPGVVTVVYHSIVWQYLTPETRVRVQHAIERAGTIATDDAPVAWVRMEPGRDPTKSAEVRISRWPDRLERVVARTGYHGRPVRSVPTQVEPAPTDVAHPTSP
ncbi:MAG TPA: DUF2332 domain-containing protein [Acidimicrobiales bacterium]|nr:DUF2332 domain-containing protein [Acidimicrobiales bacterium]